MSASDHLSGQQFVELHHGTTTHFAAQIRESGHLRPAKGNIGMGGPNLTSSADNAKGYAEKRGRGFPTEVMTFHVPHKDASKYLHPPESDLNGENQHYRLKKNLPTKYLKP